MKYYIKIIIAICLVMGLFQAVIVFLIVKPAHPFEEDRAMDERERIYGKAFTVIQPWEERLEVYRREMAYGTSEYYARKLINAVENENKISE